jgi:NAD(P)-dependent dehydrogenase (short-subunit alcohol dehydrogenase family)
VILTCSVGYQRGLIGDPLYTAAKAAVRTLGRGLAAQAEFLERSIRVNVLSFGTVSTPMTGSEDETLVEALRQWAEAHIPVRRWGARPRRRPRRTCSLPVMRHGT